MSRKTRNFKSRVSVTPLHFCFRSGIPTKIFLPWFSTYQHTSNQSFFPNVVLITCQRVSSADANISEAPASGMY